jgi:hypothetical protein
MSEFEIRMNKLGVFLDDGLDLPNRVAYGRTIARSEQRNARALTSAENPRGLKTAFVGS